MSVGVGEVKLSCERRELESAGVGAEAGAIAWSASGWMIGARGKPWVRVALLGSRSGNVDLDGCG
jgi:hypothetical protein